MIVQTVANVKHSTDGRALSGKHLQKIITKGTGVQRKFDSALGATVARDDDQQVRVIQFRDAASKPLVAGAKPALRSVATWLGIPIEELGSLDQSVSYLETRRKGRSVPGQRHKGILRHDKNVYRQTVLNAPVWEAGLTVTVRSSDGACCR